MGGPLRHAPGAAALGDELGALQGRPGLARGGPAREGARGARPPAPVGAGARRPPPAAHRGRGRAALLGGRGDRLVQALQVRHALHGVPGRAPLPAPSAAHPARGPGRARRVRSGDHEGGGPLPLRPAPAPRAPAEDEPVGGPVPRPRGPSRRTLHPPHPPARRRRRRRLRAEVVRPRRARARDHSRAAGRRAAGRLRAGGGARGRGRGPALGPPGRRRAGAAALGRPEPALGRGPRRPPIDGGSAGGVLRGGGRGQEPRLRPRAPGGAPMSPVRGAFSRRLLPIALPLALLGVGAAPYVPWEDLTEADALYDLATRFATVDGHRVHYPTPTGELATALAQRADVAALRHLAEARRELGDLQGELVAMGKWAEAARWAAAQGRMEFAFQAAGRALPGLAVDTRRALADEEVRWADAHPEAADPVT